MDDAFPELLTRARGGDRDAFQQVLEPHLPALTAFVRLRMRGVLERRASCADIVQSVCGAALEDIASVQGATPDAFKRWLFAVALNKVLARSQFHRASRRDVGREVPLATGPEAAPDDLLRSYATLCTPSRSAMVREEVARIEAAIDRLPDDYREVLLLSRIAGLPHAEVAERLGRSEVAVRKLLSRAKVRLAVLLGRDGADGGGTAS